ncbi:MAG: VCBS repeat-containing protein, partial [Verrucomicrobiae bacterium]|nr:VCBS repeat-containing protein [Verrucomicrobiae bacterium]
PDLLGGSGDGSVFFFKNIGSKTSPIFAPGIRLSTDSGQLNFGSRAVPRVHDWNEDGLLDLLVSSSTGVYWCQNAGSQTSPRLTYPRQLTAPGPTGELSSINTSNRMRLEVSDWNQDGTADLLIGNTDGTLCLFQGYRFAITSFTWSSDGTIVIQWNSAPKVKYSILTGPTPSSCKDPVASAIPSGGTTTSWQNRFLSRQQFFQIRMP